MLPSIKKAVLPVAGLGTRFLPATKSSPKEMLPLVDKPVIQYVIEEAIASGIEQIIMITGRGKNAIEDHFDRSVELENILEGKNKLKELEQVKKISDMCEFCYIRQKEPLGLGHAILRAREMVCNEPFAVLLGDDVIHSEGKPALKQLMDLFDRTGGSIIAVEKIDKENISHYGVVEPESTDDELCKVKSLVEKPKPENAPSDLAVIGRYILKPSIFDILESVRPDSSNEIQLTAGLNMLCASEELYGCRFDGKRYDAGNRLGFLIATVEYAMRRDDLGKDFRRYLSKLKI
ncbi:MAG: UTP--glucose-1-phosphate uridylyltransferase GalU [Nitrospinota bacterium]